MKEQRQHPVAKEGQEAPLGNGGHALWSEERQCHRNCEEKKPVF